MSSIEDPVVPREIPDQLESKGPLAGSAHLPACRAPQELDLKALF